MFYLSSNTHKANLKNIVCCLPTQNFQTGLVGRKEFFFAPPIPRKMTLFRLNCFASRNKKKNFFQKMTKKLLSRE